MTKKTIYFHGYLKDLVGESVTVEAGSIAEAIRFLDTLPGYAPEDGSLRSITVDEIQSEIELYGTNMVDEINVRPVMGGAGGDQGLLQVVIGISLVAVGIFIGPQASLLGLDLITGSSLAMAGGMMALGGLLQMLVSTPEVDDGDDTQTRYLGADRNTVEIGTPIPLVYGAARVPGHYLSFNTDARDVTEITDGDRKIPNLGTLAQDIVQGTGDYADGRFTYAVTRLTRLSNPRGISGRNDYWETVVASGRTDVLEPDTLVSELVTDSNRRNLRVEYSTLFVVPSDGTYEFRLENEATNEAIKITDVAADSEVSSPFALTSGRIYRLNTEFTRDPYQEIVNHRYGSGWVDNPEGTLQFREAGDIWQDFSPTDLSGVGVVDEMPISVDLEEGTYWVHDEPSLPDDITPVQPVFSSATPGPGNVPTSGWRI